MGTLLTQLDERSSQIRFEMIDFSVGELIRLHTEHEIRIQPAFQRMFRWSQAQQSRFVESILLGLPIPQIVLFQKEDGILELIDGLQRVSSLIRFITGQTPKAAEEDQMASTELEGCDLLDTLNGNTFATLDSVIQLELKRKTLRAIVIRRTNDPSLRYEMFKRLNAGGSPAEAHEIRNASLRIVGPAGERFLEFLEARAHNEHYIIVTEPLSDQAKKRLGRQELVLRFLALKNSIDTYKGSISDWLDEYSENVVKGTYPFDYEAEETQFDSFFLVLSEKFGDEAFVKHKNNRPLGGLAPAYFDAVTAGLNPLVTRLAEISSAEAKTILNEAIGHENDDFRENVGPGANGIARLKRRILEVNRVFSERLPDGTV